MTLKFKLKFNHYHSYLWEPLRWTHYNNLECSSTLSLECWLPGSALSLWLLFRGVKVLGRGLPAPGRLCSDNKGVWFIPPPVSLPSPVSHLPSHHQTPSVRTLLITIIADSLGLDLTRDKPEARICVWSLHYITNIQVCHDTQDIRTWIKIKLYNYVQFIFLFIQFHKKKAKHGRF